MRTGRASSAAAAWQPCLIAGGLRDEAPSVLDRARQAPPRARASGEMRRPDAIPVKIPVSSGRGRLDGDLTLPEAARGIVVFAHGSGSSRLSPRNRWVAQALAGRGYATLLFDLLSAEEAEDRAMVFDIGLLASRVSDALAALAALPQTAPLPLGLFGASTGAAAALCAAAAHPDRVAAVVSRGGRPDLAGKALAAVAAPTLLLVGGRDALVMALNRSALLRLGTAAKRLQVVPDATHLFEEPGALEAVVAAAGDWFDTHLGAAVSGLDGNQ